MIGRLHERERDLGVIAGALDEWLRARDARLSWSDRRALAAPIVLPALFVTVKTVEMHLGNAYRKLAINSRRQLATLLPAEELQGASTGTTP